MHLNLSVLISSFLCCIKQTSYLLCNKSVTASWFHVNSKVKEQLVLVSASQGTALDTGLALEMGSKLIAFSIFLI